MQVNYNGTDVFIERPDNFSKTSMRFKRLYRENGSQDFAVSEPNYSVEVFQLMANACQGRGFAASFDIIIEFKQIIADWECDAKLGDYCEKFYQKANITDMDPSEIVAQLSAVDIQDKDQMKRLTRCAATKIREVLEVEEFCDLQSFVITQVLTKITSQCHQKDIANFVVKLAQKDAPKAATLFPCINFDLLSGKDFNAIFTHEALDISTNFYDALAISEAHKNIKGLLNSNSKSAVEKFTELRSKYEKKFNTIYNEATTSRAGDLDKIRLRLVQQNDDLNDLAEVLENQKALLVECVKLCHRAPPPEEYLRQHKEDMLNMIDERKGEILQKIAEEDNRIDSELEKILNAAENDIEKSISDKVTVAPETIDEISKKNDEFKDLERGLTSIAKEIHEESAAVLAKVICDNLRGNEYLRVVKDDDGNSLSYKIFDDIGSEQLWDLNKEEVQRAERRIINKVEGRFDKACANRN